MARPIRLKKDGTPDMRGRSAGSRATQFKSRAKLAEMKPSEMSPQHVKQVVRTARTPSAKTFRSKVKKVSIERAKAKLPTPRKQDFPHRRVQKMIDDVYQKDGKSIRKSLMGMAQTLNAPQETLLQIKNLSDTQLELVYNEDKYLFESYWEYPIYLGEDRSVTIDEIIAKAT